MNALAARRRHPAAIAVLLMLGLFLTGALYSAFAPEPAEATTQALASQSVEEGKALFRANCASCHGVNAEGRSTGTDDQIAGPALAGVGAAAVDFQVGTGRMPMTQPGTQAARSDDVKFTDEQIAALGAYIASLAPGPEVPSEEAVDPTQGDPATGGELFRVNCAMCHNFAGSGGALTRGKYAPSLKDVSGKHIYEAMATGPQSMPVFNDANMTPESKRDIIAFLTTINEQENPGGMTLGSLGPVSEGLFAWVFGLGILVGCAVWLGAKAA
ncbi:c-type cytochrome [Phycicoccus endophyticus]|uniref:cytochrome bc1 complex diheme cytochrome c subunit n=1 Tax=Phycicoccus endophyticus TaxID=1690220 RepID=UPI001408A1B1|nr:c-type cytochrome [Phycicoccus endophyticus]NHI20944.1 c-type cytochrome [Phycicoccus endophyticus]GGL22513.1 cystathionine beta-lyase [Phycicoccus endophyticus]